VVLPERLMTLQETAEFLRVSSRTLRNWRWKGEGPVGYRVGGRVMYAVEDIERWLLSRRDPIRDGR
jgi:predicted site-specific integrase-resolvase